MECLRPNDEDANGKSQLSFNPFNKMPSHQNVCAKDKSEWASCYRIAVVAVAVVVVVVIQFGCGWHRMHLIPVHPPILCAFHIPSRCMAINSFGRFRFSLPLPWNCCRRLSQATISSSSFGWKEHTVFQLSFYISMLSIFAIFAIFATRIATMLRHICALEMQNTTTTIIIYLRNYSTN